MADWSALFRFVGLAVAGGLGSYGVIGGFFELAYYRRRDRAQEWKCQPRRWPSPKARREEILLGAANLTVASIASGVLVYSISRGGCPNLYSSLEVHGLAYTIASSVAYLLGTDFALYWAHRIFHTRRLYRAIHRVHHRWTSPTAFTAMAMHPVEFATYQSVMVVPLFLFPLNMYGVVAAVLLTNYYALVDHSGVKVHSWLPLVAPTMFHDDHHAHFHVNFGQSFEIWDRVFGTMRRKGRRYGVEVFGGKGAGASQVERAPYWDYSRGAVNETAAPDGAERPAAE